jgi:hypothetical protein
MMPKWIPYAAVGGGVLLFAILVVLALTLAQLRDSGGHIEAQDKKVAALFEAARPLAVEASDAAGQLRPAIDDARSLVAPLLRSRSGADLAGLLERFPLLDSSLRRLVAEAVPVLDRTDPALLAGTVSAVGSLTASLQTGDRLVRLIDGGSAVIADLGDRNLLARAERSAARLRKVLAVQRRTRSLQLKSLRVQRRSLEVQLRSLKHVRSLDRKTGGELPAP